MQRNADASNATEGSTCTYRFIPSELVDSSEEREYDVTLRQQPKMAKMSVVNERDRRPIEPAPILQLKWLNCSPNAIKKYLQSPFYFMVTNLVMADDTSKLLVPSQDYLSGSTVSSLHRLRDIDNTDGGFFVFGDLAVKKEGRFRLHFSLYEIVETTVHNRMTIISDEFTVFIPRKYPGPLEATFLSRMFSDQGIKMRIRKEHRLPSVNGRKRKVESTANQRANAKARLSSQTPETQRSNHIDSLCQPASEPLVSDDGHSEHDTSSSLASLYEEPYFPSRPEDIPARLASSRTIHNKGYTDVAYRHTAMEVSDYAKYPIHDIQQPRAVYHASMTQAPTDRKRSPESQYACDPPSADYAGGHTFGTYSSAASQTPSYGMAAQPRYNQPIGKPMFAPQSIPENPSFGNRQRQYAQYPEAHEPRFGSYHCMPSPPHSVSTSRQSPTLTIQQAPSSESHLASYHFDTGRPNTQTHSVGQLTPPPLLADKFSKDSNHSWGERLPPLRSIMSDTDLPWLGDKTLPSPTPHLYSTAPYNHYSRLDSASYDRRLDRPSPHQRPQQLDIKQLISRPSTPSLTNFADRMETTSLA